MFPQHRPIWQQGPYWDIQCYRRVFLTDIRGKHRLLSNENKAWSDTSISSFLSPFKHACSKFLSEVAFFKFYLLTYGMWFSWLWSPPCAYSRNPTQHSTEAYLHFVKKKKKTNIDVQYHSQLPLKNGVYIDVVLLPTSHCGKEVLVLVIVIWQLANQFTVHCRHLLGWSIEEGNNPLTMYSSLNLVGVAVPSRFSEGGLNRTGDLKHPSVYCTVYATCQQTNKGYKKTAVVCLQCTLSSQDYHWSILPYWLCNYME